MTLWECRWNGAFANQLFAQYCVLSDFAACSTLCVLCIHFLCAAVLYLAIYLHVVYASGAVPETVNPISPLRYFPVCATCGKIPRQLYCGTILSWFALVMSRKGNGPDLWYTYIERDLMI